MLLLFLGDLADDQYVLMFIMDAIPVVISIIDLQFEDPFYELSNSCKFLLSTYERKRMILRRASQYITMIRNADNFSVVL